MRTLKKALSLVLVLAMVLSLGVSAFAVEKAADYSDYADVKNTEAVDVLTAIGVLNGNDDGTFGPEGNFTRAQAAKMICYMTLGKTLAEALPAGATQFNDVPATHWAAKYIQYCANEGIIGGNGDGTFAPDGVLTASAWSKMLLCALGYKAETEGMTGTGWEINTTRLAISANVASAEDLAGAFNRDAAAKLALNTLKADMVWYDGGSKIVVNGVEIVNGATLKKVTDASSTSKNNIDSTAANVIQLAEKSFPKLKIDATTTEDSFGRPATVWKLNNKAIASAAKTPTFTFTAATTLKSLNATLKGYTVNDNSATPVVKKVTDNSFTSAAIKVVNGASALGITVGSASTDSFANELLKLIKNGALVEVYADTENNITDVVVVNYTVGKVTNVSETRDGSFRQTTYTVDQSNLSGGQTFTDPDKTNTVVLHGDITKGAVVTGVKLADNTIHLYETEKVTGAQSAYNTGKQTVTVSGTVYSVATGVYKTTTSALVAMSDFATNSSTEFNFYIDQYGFVVKTDTVASTDYAVIDAIAWVGGSGVNASGYAEARLIMPDATTKTVTVSKIGGTKVTSGTANLAGAKVDSTTNANADVYGGLIVTYSVSDDKYELTNKTSAAAATVNGAATVISKGVPTISALSKAGDNSTVYIVKTENSNGTAVYNAYTGYKNVPTISVATSKSATITYVEPASGALDYVFVDATQATTGDTKLGDIVYVIDKDDYYVDGVGDAQKKIYNNVVVNGVMTETLEVATTYTFANNGLYEVTRNDKGVVTTATEQTTSGPVYVKVTALSASEIPSNGVVKGYTYDGTEKVYVIDGTTCTEGTVESAGEGDVLYVKVVKTAAAGGSAAEQIAIGTLYIVKG